VVRVLCLIMLGIQRFDLLTVDAAVQRNDRVDERPALDSHSNCPPTRSLQRRTVTSDGRMNDGYRVLDCGRPRTACRHGPRRRRKQLTRMAARRDAAHPSFLSVRPSLYCTKVRPLRLKAQIFACPHLQNARTCMINFMNMESTDVFRIQRR